MKKKKPFLGILVAKNQTNDLTAYVPYFGGETSAEEAQKRGLEIFKKNFGQDWEVTYNNAQEMTPDEYRESIEGIDL